MITARIDVTKIDKSRLYKGQKGTYLDICLIETPDSRYGDSHMVVQAVSKEEREQGVKGNILGNAKTWGPRREEERYRSAEPATVAASAPATNQTDDIPF